jgi:hypothetical protein
MLPQAGQEAAAPAVAPAAEAAAPDGDRRPLEEREALLPLADRLDGDIHRWLPAELGLSLDSAAYQGIRSFLKAEGVQSGRQFADQYQRPGAPEFKAKVPHICGTEDYDRSQPAAEQGPLWVHAETAHSELLHVHKRKLARAVKLLLLLRGGGSGEGGGSDLDAWLDSMNLKDQLSQPLKAELGATTKSDLTDPTL